MRTRIVVRRFVAAIVVAVAVIAAALTATGALTSHYSLADNGVISSRNRRRVARFCQARSCRRVVLGRLLPAKN